jgi:predicted nucleic acid-binding protein
MHYVAIAERTGDVLVTADKELRLRLGHLGWVKLISDA